MTPDMDLYVQSLNDELRKKLARRGVNIPGSVALQVDPRINVITGQPFGDGSPTMPYQTATGTSGQSRTEEGSTSEQIQETRPIDEETEALLRDRLSQDPIFQRGVQGLDRQEMLARLMMERPQSLDITPTAKALEIITGTRGLASIPTPKPTAEQDMALYQKMVNDQIEGARNLAVIQDAFRKGQLQTKFSRKDAIKDVEKQDQGASQTNTNILPSSLKPSGGKGGVSVFDKKQQEALATFNKNLQEISNISNSLVSTYDKYKGKMPGIGPRGFLKSKKGQVVDFLGGKQSESDADATDVRNKLDWLSALQVYDRSGKAVTAAEFERAQRTVTGGKLATRQEFETAFNHFLKTYKEAQEAAYQGFQPENVEAVRQRQNKLPLDLPEKVGTTKKPAQGSSKTDRAKALGF
jgi:hypothetical protein